MAIQPIFSRKSVKVFDLMAAGKGSKQIMRENPDISRKDVARAAQEALRLSADVPDHHQRMRVKDEVQYRGDYLSTGGVPKPNRSDDNGERSNNQQHLVAIKARYPNAYKRWTKPDDQTLKTMKSFDRAAIVEMSERLQRQPSAIHIRLQKLRICRCACCLEWVLG